MVACTSCHVKYVLRRVLRCLLDWPHLSSLFVSSSKKTCWAFLYAFRWFWFKSMRRQEYCKRVPTFRHVPSYPCAIYIMKESSFYSSPLVCMPIVNIGPYNCRLSFAFDEVLLNLYTLACMVFVRRLICQLFHIYSSGHEKTSVPVFIHMSNHQYINKTRPDVGNGAFQQSLWLNSSWAVFQLRHLSLQLEAYNSW